MHRPSDYAHAYGDPRPIHGRAPGEGGPAQDAGGGSMPDDRVDDERRPCMELATFRLLYESERICLFETRDGHLTAVDASRLA